VLDFLVSLFQANLGYSMLNTARAALSALVLPLDGKNIGEHPLVIRFMKGVKQSRPSLPRYSETWDAGIVVKFLKNMTTNSLKGVTLKLTMLLALITAQRAQTLHALKLNDMTYTQQGLTFRILTPLKNRKPGTLLNIFRYQDPELCPVMLLEQYIQATTEARNGQDQVLLSYIRPHGAVTRDTVRRWILEVMKLAGINTAKFTAHSTRAASTSAAKAGNVPTETIMEAAMWQSEDIFHKFYHKPVATTRQNDEFATVVLRQ
jgi:integrase